jgi:hypothetical protein
MISPTSDDPPPHAVAVTIQLPLIVFAVPGRKADYLEKMTSLQIGDIVIFESLATRHRPVPRGMIVRSARPATRSAGALYRPVHSTATATRRTPNAA